MTDAVVETVNPATGEMIHRYTCLSVHDAERVVNTVHAAYLAWRDSALETRSDCLRQLASLLRERKSHYAALMAEEMGKPLAQAECEKCAILCLHYADHAADYLQSRPVKTEAAKSYVAYEPLGVVYGIMPWNYPFWQVFRFAVPAIMAGNAAVLKHAPIATGSALAIEALFLDAGFPPALFKSLIIDNDVSARLIAHANIAAVTFTGSVAAGAVIAAQAGQALKKTVLELGGCDAYVILNDADLALAASAGVASRMLNAGQSCIAAKRFIVVESVREKFISLITEKLKSYVMGNPFDDATTCGPLARRDIRDTVHQQVQACVAQGATLLMGGFIPNTEGFYYPPTIISNIKKGMPAYDEEIFGPVFAVLAAKDEEDAITIANDTPYGLGAAVFTQDVVRGEMIASKKLQAGTCVVNTFVASDPRLPFGGIKHSGYGRELSVEGIRSFVNIKTVTVQ